MEDMDRFVDIVRQLRAPGGCPWDIAQTFASLKPHIIEEAYELAEAMDREDVKGLKEELGDVLLHVVMLSNMARERGWFSIEDVTIAIMEKMIRRHPHVFGDVTVATADGVVAAWETVKLQENGQDKGLFDSIPKALPALMRAEKIGKRVSRDGFDWPDMQGAFDKLEEEIAELKQAVQDSTRQEVELELGDVLFSVVNVSRHLGIKPEEALQQVNQKFMSRYETMCRLIAEQGLDSVQMSVSEKEVYWSLAKKDEQK